MSSTFSRAELIELDKTAFNELVATIDFSDDECKQYTLQEINNALYFAYIPMDTGITKQINTFIIKKASICFYILMSKIHSVSDLLPDDLFSSLDFIKSQDYFDPDEERDYIELQRRTAHNMKKFGVIYDANVTDTPVVYYNKSYTTDYTICIFNSPQIPHCEQYLRWLIQRGNITNTELVYCLIILKRICALSDIRLFKMLSVLYDPLMVVVLIIVRKMYGDDNQICRNQTYSKYFHIDILTINMLEITILMTTNIYVSQEEIDSHVKHIALFINATISN